MSMRENSASLTRDYYCDGCGHTCEVSVVNGGNVAVYCKRCNRYVDFIARYRITCMTDARRRRLAEVINRTNALYERPLISEEDL